MAIQKQQALFKDTGSYRKDTSLAPFASSWDAPKDEIRTIEEFGRQRLALEGQRLKSDIGAAAIGELREFSTATYLVTTGTMHTMKEQVVDKDHGQFVSSFVDRQCEDLGNNLLALNQIAAKNIAAIVDMPLYMAPEPPKKHWWQK